MARTSLPPRPRPTYGPQSIAIVGSLYNRKLVDSLVDSAHEELKAILPGEKFPIFRVPGAFEIPVTVENLCRRGAFSAVIALGVIIRGETAHADLVATSVTDGLQNIAIEHGTPIIHEVLLVDTERHAFERCMGTEINRGIEAARAAAGMADLFGQIANAYPANHA